MNYKKVFLGLLISITFPANITYAENISKDNIILLKGNNSKNYDNLANNVNKILEDVKNLRSLTLKKPVPVGVKTNKELNTFLKGIFNKEYSDKDLRKDTLLMERLGLIKKGVNLKTTFLDLYTAQIAGLYDTDAKELYVIENSKMSDLESSLVISHELTHALQDQNFDLNKFLSESKNNSDMALARTALIEGEAMFASMQYIIKNTAESGLKGLGSLLKNPLGSSIGSMDSLKDVPGFIVEQMMFPYIKGNEFVTYVYGDLGGWEKFNSVYQRPPESTEQIMHPEKYLSQESPVKVNYNEKVINAANWKLISKDTFGEFFLLNYFLEYLGEDEAKVSSSGWGGDIFAFYAKDNSNENILIYKSMWDTEKDAKEFFDSYRNSIEVRYENKLKTVKNNENIYHSLSPEGEIYLILNGKSVNIAEGFDKTNSKNILSYLDKP